MPGQDFNWSCSACSLAWIERATGVNTPANETSAIVEIGYPGNINSTYGLMDGSGAALADVLISYGLDAHTKWVTFDEAYVVAELSTGCLGGGGWYHWVSIRGILDRDIHLANSAPGYGGVYDRLSREQFNALGPFSLVYLR